MVRLTLSTFTLLQTDANNAPTKYWVRTKPKRLRILKRRYQKIAKAISTAL